MRYTKVIQRSVQYLGLLENTKPLIPIQANVRAIPFPHIHFKVQQGKKNHNANTTIIQSRGDVGLCELRSTSTSGISFQI